MLNDWDKKYPGRIETMFRAMHNIVPSHLMDNKQFDFKTIKATGLANQNGDIAFDQEVFNHPNIIKFE